MTGPITECFSENYAEARTRFVGAARKAGAEIRSFPISEAGPAGEELSIDIAYLGAERPARLLVIDSGIHGVEGFAGSAIQIQFLKERIGGPELPRSFGVLLIHALNPYGFAHLRRANECNVDLNRNFVAHPGGHVANSGYEALDSAINPKALSPQADAQARACFAMYLKEYGERALQEAISRGQYFNSGGIYFGGREEQTSVRIIRQIAREELRGATQVAWIDIHTGLGQFGDYVMLYEADAADEAFARGQRWYGEKAQAEAGGQALSPPLPGTIDEGIRRELAGRCELTFFAQEFGTYDTTRVFWATRAENWLHHHGGADCPRAKEIKQELREVFAPASAIWQRRVLEGGARVIEQAIRGLLSEEA